MTAGEAQNTKLIRTKTIAIATSIATTCSDSILTVDCDILKRIHQLFFTLPVHVLAVICKYKYMHIH